MKIKAILKKYKIRQTAIADAVGISKTSLNHIVHFGRWPKKPEDLQAQIEQYLIDKYQINITDDIWDIDEDETKTATATVTDIEELFMHKEMITQIARSQFNLFRDPFTDDVNAHEDVYISKEQRYIRETLYQAAKNGGFVAVIGESGAGKTVLRRDLVDRIVREDLNIRIISPVMPDKTRVTAAAIEDAIIYDLDEHAKPKRAHEAKARQMHKLLSDSSRAGNSHCLIIEEAHDLSLPVLKQLKRFWEMEDGFKKLLSIVLIGQPELKAKLNERLNWEAREVIRRCEIAELPPLGDFLGDYLAHKFARVGAEIDTIFSTDAMDAMDAKLTQTTRDKRLVKMSYPLIVNNLTIKALNTAAEIGADRIDAGIIASV